VQFERLRFLDHERESLLADVRALLADVRVAFSSDEGGAEARNTLAESARRLDELFVVVIVGEFNAGKSAFLNALLGQTIAEEGVTPTTASIQILEYGDQIERTQESDAVDRVTAPVELLRDLRLVDTPGTNAIERRHEAITERFVPQADLVLFVTSSDRPFSESERVFLKNVKQWGKKIVAVVNKSDLLQSGEDREKVREFVGSGLHALLGVEPELFFVSARQALTAKREGDSAGIERSGFLALEEHVASSLDARERFRLKLLNPLGVADRLMESHTEAIDGQLEVLRGDVEAVEQIDGQLTVYEEDLRKGFDLRFGDVDLILHQFEARGYEFFDELLRIGRVFDLLNQPRVRQDFERLVVADAPEQIESKVDELIDWLITSDLGQWRAVRDHFERRKSEHSQRILGGLDGGFEYNRTRLLDTVGRAAQETLAGYDKAREARRMADGARDAVTNTALLEVGAVGLGAAISLIATSTAVDVTGLTAAGVMAAVGLFVLPRKRQNAKAELRDKISTLRTRLRGALNEQLEKEVERSAGKIRETIVPYTRFVRGEQSKLTERNRTLAALAERSAVLRSRLAN